jgi:uncharacterized protein YhaN
VRLERLAIPAFGPFTQFALELPAAGGDFHLIYGPNEAGKSSLLRAIRDLLFGIDHQTPDNFLHDYRDLRIGATLCSANGRCLRFQRRKGNRNTLLDEGGQPLPDETLAGWLGVVDRAFFTTVFGLGAEELRRGAEGLLHGRGELGQALFSASLAGTPVHRILAALDEEARQLFSGRARTQVTIRPAVSEYEEHLRRSKEWVVRPEDWEAVVEALGQASDERDRLDAELARQRERRDWLQRCLDALPVLGQLAEQQARRAALPPLPEVGPDFIVTAERALAARDRASSDATYLRERIAQLEARVRGSEPSAEVLAEAAAIGSVHQRLAVYRQWCDELVGLEADRARQESALRAGMARLGLDGQVEVVDALRLPIADELRLREAASQLDLAEAARQRNRDAATDLRQALDKVETRLGALPSDEVGALRAAVRATASAAELVQGLGQREAAVAAALARRDQAHGLLRGAPSEPEATCELPVPGAATLRRFADEAAAIERARVRVAERRAEADAQITRLSADLHRIERDGALPKLEALWAARAHRDRAWGRVRAAWLNGDAAGEIDGESLAVAYPRMVTAADRLADRLREEAGAVAQAEELRRQRAEGEGARANAAAEAAQIERAQEDWEARWRTAWQPCGLVPQSPAEMLEWREHWVELRTRYEAWALAVDELARARGEIGRAQEQLRSLLPDLGDASLMDLRNAAEERVRRADEAQGARAQLQVQMADYHAERAALEAAAPALAETLSAARADWQTCCEAAGLIGLGTASTLSLVEERKQLVAQLDALRGLREAIGAKQRAIADYEESVRSLAQRLGLLPGSIDVQEAALWEALEAAQARRAQQVQAAADLEDLRAQIIRYEQALAETEEELVAILATAGATDEEGLRSLLGVLKERQEIDAGIAQLRQTLHVPARGESLATFVERVRAEPPDGLAAEAAGLDEAMARSTAQRDRAIERVAKAQSDKARLEQAGAEAAEHRQAAMHVAARIRHDAARYLRLRLACHFLRAQIEEFRRASQAPLLARAGALFAAITDGRFDGLGAAFDADDTPILVGLRAGKEVRVEGMSDGTRDQLYLALRLAAIERHQEHHEPMPVILDDLLATFDDRRAGAILKLLSELGRTTQVLLLTHHRHLVELAREALADDGLQIHVLGSVPGL